MLRKNATGLLLLLGVLLVPPVVAAEDADFQKIRASFLGKWKGDLNVGGTVISEWTEIHSKFICATMDLDTPLGNQSYILVFGRDHEGLKAWKHQSGKKVREATVSWDGDTMVTVGPPTELGLTHFFYQLKEGEVVVRGCFGKDGASLFEARLKRQKDEPGGKGVKTAKAGATP